MDADEGKSQKNKKLPFQEQKFVKEQKKGKPVVSSSVRY